MANDELCAMSAQDLLDAYRGRSLSPVEVTEATLERIDALNPRLTAFITITPERAREDARRAEQAYRDGSAGPLCGVPTSIKDLVATKGIRTTRGSLLSENWVPDQDPVFVQRLYAAGIVMLGKTNTPEGGWKGDSGNRIVGPTHNPWRHGLTAGGSSGGAAAAVATGMGPLAQGGDGAGSIRIPAAFSGVFGHKPSYSRVPYPGSSPTTLAHTGPMSRTVGDAALMLDVMSGADPSDRFSLDTRESFVESLNGSIAGIRVAWSPDFGYATVNPDVARVCRDAMNVFVDLGCEIEEANPGLEDPWEIIDKLFLIGQVAGVADRFEEVRDKLDPGRAQQIERAWNWSAVDLQQAQLEREEYYAKMTEFMRDYDLLISPTLPITAFEAGEDYPAEILGVPQHYLSWTPFTYPFNLTGQPSASIPCGFTDEGLPVGLQITGRWRDDATVLRAAARFEEAQPWRQWSMSEQPEGAR